MFLHPCADLIEGLVRGAHEVELPSIVQAELGQGGPKRGSENIKELCIFVFVEILCLKASNIYGGYIFLSVLQR